MSVTTDAWTKDIENGFSKEVVVKYAKNHLKALVDLLSLKRTASEIEDICSAIADTKTFIEVNT